MLTNHLTSDILTAEPPNGAGTAGGTRPASRAMADSLGLPFVGDLSARPASAEFVEKIPIGFARQHGIIGLAADANGNGNGRMPVALGDLSAWGQLQVLSRFLGKPVEPMLAPPADVAAAINAAYQERTGQAQTFIEKIERLDAGDLRDELDLVPLDPQWRAFFADGATLDLHADRDRMGEALDAFAPGRGLGRGYGRFMDLSARLSAI